MEVNLFSEEYFKHVVWEAIQVVAMRTEPPPQLQMGSEISCMAYAHHPSGI
jgi:hypothetical protein